ARWNSIETSSDLDRATVASGSVICHEHRGRYHGTKRFVAFSATEVAQFAEHQARRKTYRPDRNAARIERDGAAHQPGHRPRVDPDRPADFAGRSGAPLGPWAKHSLANCGATHRRELGTRRRDGLAAARSQTDDGRAE